ncbi:ABC transporter ATP-binding protein [Candidatus Peregrinibacteria bacterium HGW-Peregrinibacteria-1]|jgi:ATP-binding cassette subfamily F protein 3|nr:MAG: ABC transporter ATP-binding protein [Candidatus Peregrinibacteria bacterium HGW-Peregrinibacteria-1]
MSTLLQVSQLNKSYGHQVIFEGADLTIAERQKIAVVGRNGAGKSTLFRIITGEETPTSGQVKIHAGTRIGYLTQHSPFQDDESVIDFLTRDSGKPEWECGKIADRFQIKPDLFYVPAESLAGGYQMRIKLISMLLHEPNLLLLDEPTNYLDLSTQILLEKFLQTYNGAFMLISHDREFIKKTCTSTLEIERGETSLYPGSLEDYLAYKAEQTELKEKFNKNVERKKQHLQKFVDRFGAKASKASQAQSKLKQIHKLKTIEILNPLSTARINIPKIEAKQGIALTVDQMTIGYPDKEVAKNINLEVERGEHIAIVGDNGQGKTTFLKTIAGEINALSGQFKWGHNISIGYYAQHTPATLLSDNTVKEHLSNAAGDGVTEQEIFEMAGNFLFKDEFLKKKISVLSGGEKARLCLAGLLLQRHQVLLLDEPTNHLDFETVESLAQGLQNCNSTVLFISHNRTFVDVLATGIIEVKNGQVARYHHNYEEYVYHITQDIEDDLTPPPKTSKKPATDSPQPSDHQTRQRLKEIKKQIRTLENTIQKNETQKLQILKWFEDNPDYNEKFQEKTTQLAEIDKILTDSEATWIKLQEEMEVIG